MWGEGSRQDVNYFDAQTEQPFQSDVSGAETRSHIQAISIHYAARVATHTVSHTHTHSQRSTFLNVFIQHKTPPLQI